MLEGVVVFGVWGAREPGEGTNSIPNIQSGDDISAYQFAEDIAVGETFLSSQ